MGVVVVIGLGVVPKAVVGVLVVVVMVAVVVGQRSRMKFTKTRHSPPPGRTAIT